MIFFGIENIVFVDISNWPSCDTESFLSMYRNDFLNASNRKCSIYRTIFSINRIKNVRYIESIFCRFFDISNRFFVNLSIFWYIESIFLVFITICCTSGQEIEINNSFFFVFFSEKLENFGGGIFFFIKMWLEDGIFYLEILE